MKKMIVFLLMFCLMLAFTACGSMPRESAGLEKKHTELTVFAAASMTEAMTGIAKMYAEIAPDVDITFTFDSSGTLKKQIENGADCDIFISASQKTMDQLDITAGPEVNTSGLDFVMEDTRFDMVSNYCVLIVPEGNPAGISSFEDAATDSVSLISLGNSDVPAGQYAREIFEHLGIWEDIQNKISFAGNVKEVTSHVSEMAADCGVVYATDAISAGLDWVDAAEDGWHTPAVYPAAVLNTTRNEEAARAFVEYLKSDEAAVFLESMGFSIPGKK
jgi:molybdate transport system substrate-binding protein